MNVDTIPRDALLRWLEINRVTWPQVHDGKGLDGELPRRFDVKGIPFTVLFDREGRVVAANLRGADLLGCIAEQLAQASVRVPSSGAALRGGSLD